MELEIGYDLRQHMWLTHTEKVLCMTCECVAVYVCAANAARAKRTKAWLFEVAERVPHEHRLWAVG